MKKANSKWTKSKVQNLVKSTATGVYFGKAKIGQKKKYKSLKTTDFETACRKLPGFLDQVAKLRKAAKKNSLKVTVGGLIREFEKQVSSDRDLSENGKKARLYAIKRLETTWPECLELAPAQVDFESVKAWVRRLSEDGTSYVPPGAKKARKGNSSSSINKTILALAGALDLAHQRGLVSENVARVRGLRVADSAEKGNIPSREDFARVVAEMGKNSPHAAFCARMISQTGCRIQEARSLRFKHADFDRKVLLIPGTKTKSSDRAIPMTTSLELLLRSYRMEIEGIAGRNVEELPAFPLKCLNATLKRVTTKLGIKPFKNHDLRDYYATSCLEAGVPVHTVAAWMGHADGGALLLKTYAHLRDSHASELAEGVRF